MPAHPKLIAYHTERRAEALHVSHALEPLHPALPLSCRTMRVFRAIIQSPALPMGNPRHYLDKRCGVALETIRYYGARTVTQTLQQLPKEALRRFLVPLSLNQDVEDLAALIDRTPQIDPGAVHFAKDFVQVPSVAPPH